MRLCPYAFEPVNGLAKVLIISKDWLTPCHQLYQWSNAKLTVNDLMIRL
jgi:hypothetical protein